MNNEQFRRLVGGSTPKPATDSTAAAAAATPSRAPGAALGSRKTSSIPMTPRSLGGVTKSDFARQLAERNLERDQRPNQQKKPRSSAPKGSKLAEGYVDRAEARNAQAEDDREARIKALEESLKKEEIDQETFDKLRSQIAGGGDLSSTHLVKGLDFKLLQRVRQGEDVFDANAEDQEKEDGGEEEGAEPEDVDDAFERLEDSQVTAVEREKASKKGQLSTAPLNPGKKRTRDQILAEMKAARAAATAKAQADAALGSRFKKIGGKVPGSTRIETDAKGREVLIVVDEDGHEKRKVRKFQPASAPAEEAAPPKDLMMPDKDAKPLGMEVPEIYRKKMEEEPEDVDVDIFDDVGDDYDPLAGLDDSDDSEDEGSGDEAKAKTTDKDKSDRNAMPPPPPPGQAAGAGAAGPVNYFKDSKTALVSSETLKAPSMSDPAIQAAFKRAAALNVKKDAEDEAEGADEARAKAERHRRMLQGDDRDAADMDMGFGTSRFEDDADFDDSKVKLSKWGQDDGEEGEEGGKGGGAKRKRGPKKRKGDGNNADDVMKIVEKRRAAG